MRLSKFICLALLLGAVFLAGLASAGTYPITGGSPIVGEPVSPDDKGVRFRVEGESLPTERVAWEKFSQETLKQILAANPKTKQYIDPLIEPSIEEKKAVQKAAIVVKDDYEKLERPATGSLIKGLFTTPIGIFCLLLIYAGNIYAGYEISIFRARPPGLVVAAAALLPILGNIIFLCIPTHIEDKSEIVQEPMREKDAYQVEGVLPEAEAAIAAEQHALATANALPETQVYKRGQFTFNRRFLETKFASYFHLIRSDADKDMVLTFTSTRGEYEVQRIASIGAESVNLQVSAGGASTEVSVPFLEIQMITVRHKDA